MEYKAELSKEAEKYLAKQTGHARKRLEDALEKLPDGDVRKMSGRDGYRLTVGGFRVLFKHTNRISEDGKSIIDVAHIGPRGDIYK